MNETMRKFGYPETEVKEYRHWVALLRPAQITLGSLVLACKDEARAFSGISPAAFAELAVVVGDVEKVLHELFAYDRINYLMLMMVDPDVHFHVVPRYARPVRFEESEHADSAWPGPPDVRSRLEVPAATLARLRGALIARWP